MVLLGDGQRRVELHPVDEVAELAHPAADGLAGLCVGNDQPCAVAVRGAGRANEVPERKCFARTDEDAVDLRRGEREIDRFVVLQYRIDLAERAADERVVAADERGKRRFHAHFRKVLAGGAIPQRAERAVLFDRNAVRERRKLTEQFAVHIKSLPFLLSLRAAAVYYCRPCAAETAFTP